MPPSCRPQSDGKRRSYVYSITKQNFSTSFTIFKAYNTSFPMLSLYHKASLGAITALYMHRYSKCTNSWMIWQANAGVGALAADTVPPILSNFNCYTGYTWGCSIKDVLAGDSYSGPTKVRACTASLRFIGADRPNQAACQKFIDQLKTDDMVSITATAQVGEIGRFTAGNFTWPAVQDPQNDCKIYMYVCANEAIASGFLTQARTQHQPDAGHHVPIQETGFSSSSASAPGWLPLCDSPK